MLVRQDFFFNDPPLRQAIAGELCSMKYLLFVQGPNKFTTNAMEGEVNKRHKPDNGTHASTYVCNDCMASVARGATQIVAFHKCSNLYRCFIPLTSTNCHIYMAAAPWQTQTALNSCPSQEKSKA